MVKWWTLIKDQYCNLIDEPCLCPDTGISKSKTADCDSCPYYRYWVFLKRPERPFRPDKWKMREWEDSQSMIKSETEVKK